jgi:hypothetical protein
VIAPTGLPSGDQPAADSDADHWREAARLRRDQPGWIVIWLAPIRRFLAYARTPGTRRATALIAATSADLTAQIGKAEADRQTDSRSKDRM